MSLLSKELSRVFSNTTVRKHQFFGAQPSLWSSSRCVRAVSETTAGGFRFLCPVQPLSSEALVLAGTLENFIHSEVWFFHPEKKIPGLSMMTMSPQRGHYQGRDS